MDERWTYFEFTQPILQIDVERPVCGTCFSKFLVGAASAPTTSVPFAKRARVDISELSMDQVETWLREHGFDSAVPAFRESDIHGLAFAELMVSDLAEIGVTPRGLCMRIVGAIRREA